MAQIYRKAALDKLSSPEQLDKMIVIIQPSFWIAALGGAAIILSALIWSVFGRLPQKVAANGIYMDESGIRAVTAEVNGIVAEVLVADGEQVSVGQEIARLNAADAQKQLDALLERRAGVEAVRFDSENDTATADNKSLLDIKAQKIAGGSTLVTNRALLESKMGELEQQSAATAEAKEKFEAAKKTYYASMGGSSTTSEQLAYQNASSNLQTAKQHQEYAASTLAEIQNSLNTLRNQRSEHAAALLTAQSALTGAQSELLNAESTKMSAQAALAGPQLDLENAQAAYQAAQLQAGITEEELQPYAAAVNTAQAAYNAASANFTAAQTAYETAAAAVTAAENDVQNCQTQIDGIDAQITSMEAQLTDAQTTADAQNASLSSAQSKYVKSEQEYIDAMQAQASRQAWSTRTGTEYQAALNAYSTAVNQLSSLQDSVNQLQAQVAAEEANLDSQNAALMLQFNSAKGAVLEQLDQEINRYRQQIEDSTIRSTMTGYISGLNIAKGNTIQQGSVVCRISAEEDAERIVICYVPVAEGRKLAPGMRTEIYPTTVNKQEYGHMEGTVREVAEFVTSQDEIRNQLGDVSLVQTFTQNGAVVAVKVALRTDCDTASGYWWSSRKGSSVIVNDGTLVSADIVTEEKAPITLLIPFLKEKLTIRPVDSGKAA